ncbi:FIST domain-containing protein [Durusdinium trenchii]|uniref:FIST domain-containing protein n=1 Tax=Durusdinium trenchii TaxID=1381693 RepID=A0ABP0PJH6_9DINO
MLRVICSLRFGSVAIGLRYRDGPTHSERRTGETHGSRGTRRDPRSKRPDMNPLVAVGPDGQVRMNQDALKRAKAENKVKCARYLRFAFFAHVTLLIIVNIVVWLIYAMLRSKDRGGTYKWPLWVTFGSIVLIIAHLLSMLPYAVCRANSNCPRWVWVVLLNLALVNVVAWAVYATTESQACPVGVNCEYLWPAWVSGSTALVALVVSLLPCICGALFGIHDDVGDSELEEAFYESESE